MEKEQIEVEPKALRYVAKCGDGSMRDALSLLDQCIAFYLGQKLTYDKVLEVLGTVDNDVFSNLLRKVLVGDVTGCIYILEEILTSGKELTQFVTDFTWYLRNLLLVKTSDDAEDVLDVSSENLLALKEESQMVDADTLMRYIRVLSELSNQLRYATQKRVLVEIGLIKLCRPAMETNLDSLFDRIRILEEKMEQGIMVAPQNVNANSYTAGKSSLAEPVEQAPAKKPEKAAPEDLQKIVANWKVIVNQTTAVFKQMLLKSVPKYNGETGAPILSVEFQDFHGQKNVDDPESKAELIRIIEEVTGKTVEIQMLVANQHQHTNLSQITVDQAIRENIHMDVIIEDDPDEEAE